MPWDNSPAARRRSAIVYGNPEYQKNRAIVRRRSGGLCEEVINGKRCASADRVQTDHIVPVSQGGSHAISNLMDRCKPHHDKKTANEGGGYRRKILAPDPAAKPTTKW